MVNARSGPPRGHWSLLASSATASILQEVGRRLHAVARRSSRREALARWVENLEPRRLLADGPIISEFLASNHNGIMDEDGDRPDWIEIHNPTPATINLDGYYLTNDPANLTKWRMPAVSLSSGGYQLVFASGKNRAVAGQFLHTNFQLAAEGQYLALVKPDGISIAWEYAPQYPEQLADVSYGITVDPIVTHLIGESATMRTLVPANGDLGLLWTTWDFADTAWTAGTSGAGYDIEQPPAVISGFTVRMVDIGGGTDGYIDHIGEAISILDGTAPAGAYVVQFDGTADAATINHGNGGAYGGDLALPNGYGGSSADQEAAQRTDYALRCTANVTIPAGQWTINVNSDDGFLLRIPGVSFITRSNTNYTGTSWTSSTVPPDVLVYGAPRGPGNTFATFTIPTGGLTTTLTLDFYERGGGDTVELAIASGHRSRFSTATFTLLSDGVGGWSVKTTSSTPAPSYDSLIGVNGNLESQMYNKNATAYIRLPFGVDIPGDFDTLKLRIKYDDGFIAYLNGQKVAERNPPTTAPSWNSSAGASHPDEEALVYEEIDISEHLGALRAGNNVLAIHGLNYGAGDTDFLIYPLLDGIHTQLNQQRYFTTPTPGRANDPSNLIGRVADTRFDHDRGFYDAPFDLVISTETPGAEIRYTLNGSAPTATTGIVYTGPIRISGTTTVRAAAFKPGYIPTNVDTQTYLFLDDVIRQSATGQSPGPDWPSAGWVNGQIIDYGMDPDVVNNPAYSATIKDDLKAIPTFSIVMDLKDLFDPTRGIYVNARQDGRAWERPASIELIYPDGTVGFQADVGIRIRGGYSRSGDNPKHAFRIFFRDEYGQGSLNYPLFGPDAAQSFEKFDLRTFQNYSWSYGGDSRGVFVRDQFSRDAQLALGHDGERGDFYHLYINGQYWGLYNTAERPDGDFAASYWGGDDDDYDVIKVDMDAGYTIYATNGNMDAWTELWNLCKAGLSTNAAYQRILGRNPDGTRNPAYPVLLDDDNLIDYMLIVLYTGNFDAPISAFLGNQSPNNFFAIRNRNGDVGFRFVNHDNEHTLLLGSTQAGDGLTVDRTGPYPAGDTLNKSNPQWIWQQCLANAEFRMKVADHIYKAFFNNGVLTAQGARELFLRRINEIDRAVVGESARWGDSKRSTPLTRNVEWISQVNSLLNTYFPQRSGIVLNQLIADGLWPSVAPPVFNRRGGMVSSGFQLTMSASQGTIYYTLDGSDPRAIGGSVSGSARLYTGPIPISQTTRVKARVLSGTTWSALEDCLFTLDLSALRITELMYHPEAPPAGSPYAADDFEFVELQNTGSSAVNLLEVTFTAGITFSFGNTVLEPGQRTVVVKNLPAFQSRYGTQVSVAGVFSGSLSNGGEQITLKGPLGQVLMDFSYSDGWYPITDGQGYSLVIIDATGPASSWNQKSSWRPSNLPGGGPGVADPGLNPDSVVINEIMSHTDDPAGDWVELHNTTDQPIDVSGWFLSDSATDLRKYQIQPGTIIPAHGYLVLTQLEHFGQAGNPGVNVPFAFSELGEEVYLSNSDGAGNVAGYRDSRDFAASERETTFGRYVKSTGTDFVEMSAPTPWQANATPRVGPVVINEIMYGPPVGKDEFIELKNITGAPVPLYDPVHPENTWRFLRGVTFDFPAGATIAPFGYALVVPIDPNEFRAKYGINPSVPIFGPYTGTLDNAGENLELGRPSEPEQDGFVPYLSVDRVKYDSTLPWPTSPNGTGPSLARRSATAYGNDVVNWAAERTGGTPGAENLDTSPPTVDIIDVVPDPRNTGVAWVTIVFSEPITGFDLADLTLTRDGSPVSLVGTTLATADNIAWTLGDLTSRTAGAGTYVLTVRGSGSGIADGAGNLLLVGATDTFVVDTTMPAASIVPVSPDPRNSPVQSVQIVFSEAVAGFDLGDLELRRNGVPLSLSGATLMSTDNITWTLGGLSGWTAGAGSYELNLAAAGSGIMDMAGNALAAGASESWVMDTAGPTVSIVPVSPDPRRTAVQSIEIVFSETVSGFGLADLALSWEGVGVSLATAWLDSADGIHWTLSDLELLTDAPGRYVLSLVASGSGIMDMAGNALAAGASESWVMDTAGPTVSIIPVSPDPRNTPVEAIDIVFSEPVAGFDLNDLTLRRDGQQVPLTGASLVSSAAAVWVLENLAALTAADGVYELELNAEGSGIVDAAGNALGASAGTGWVMRSAGSVSGKLFQEYVANGVAEPGERSLAGWTVFIDMDDDGLPGPLEPATGTGSDGTYQFSGLAAGSYLIRVVPAGDYVPVFPASASRRVEISAGQNVAGADFSFFATIIEGTAARDEWYICLGAGNIVQVFDSDPAVNTPRYAIARDLLPSLALRGGGGDDRLTIDLAAGDPTPAGSLWFYGETGLGDCLRILGSSAEDSVAFFADRIVLGQQSTVNVAGLEAVEVETGGGDDVLTFAASLPFAPFFNLGAGQNRLMVTDGSHSFGQDLGNLDVIVTAHSVLQLSGRQLLRSLQIEGQGVVRVAGGGASVLVVEQLSVSGDAALDLGDNDLIVHASASTRQAVYSAVNAWVASGRNRGTSLWRGAGINSSSAAADRRTGLATLVNERGNTGQVITPVFAGLSVGLNDILVKYTYNGDANIDGRINADDYFLIDSGFLSQAGGYRNGDANYDGKVDADDYFLVDSAFLGQQSPLGSMPAPVAEDARVCLATVGAASAGIRREPSPMAQLFSTAPLL